MILVIIIGVLALFSLISIVLGTDEPRRSDVGTPRSDVEPANHMWYLMRYGAR
jgi:tetrahydromethanopterin S-methyltransferase subunit E